MVNILPYSYLKLPISQEWPLSDKSILFKMVLAFQFLRVSRLTNLPSSAFKSSVNFRVEIPFYKNVCVIILNVRIKPYKSIKHFYVMLAIRLNS